MYNKTKEMEDQEMKHYIVDYWKICGLDIERPVWRTEIRICAGGKTIKEFERDEIFSFSISDIVTQETLEQMFHTYAAKYFRFVKRDHHVKAQQMIPLKLLSSISTPKMRPKRATKDKNSSRMHKIIINNLNSHLYENSKLESQDIVQSIEKVKEYFISAYRLEKWNNEQDVDHGPPGAEIDYKKAYSHFSSDIAERAAESYKSLIDKIQKYRQKKQDENNERHQDP
jgi:hypothetical protein